MRKVEYLILGAGVSGLAFANHVGHSDYLILEREREPGGYCRTTKRGEYVWDYAGHFFHFSHPQLKKNFEAVTTSEETVYRVKNTKIYYKGYYVDYPFQKNIHQLTKDELIECIYDLFEKSEKNRYDSFLDMLYGKFGKSITEKFLRPYNEKLYACDLNLLDVNAMGRFFPEADLESIIRNMKAADNASYNSEFLYPKRGAEVFVNKLLEKLEMEKIHLGERVQSVNTDKHIVITDKDRYQYDYLISSLPFHEFIKMSDIVEQVDCSVFSYNQVLVLNLGFDQKAVDSDIHWIYVPSKEINFYRAGFYNNIIGSKKLSMYIEIGYDKDYVITDAEITRQLDLTIDNLRRMKIIRKHRLTEHQAIIMNPAYVHITQKSMETVGKLKEMLAENHVYTVGRYGDWKYCSIEDCMVDSLNIAKQIKG